jgi:hypothetical protein
MTFALADGEVGDERKERGADLNLDRPMTPFVAAVFIPDRSSLPGDRAKSALVGANWR